MAETKAPWWWPGLRPITWSRSRPIATARVTPKRGRSVPPVPGFASFPSGPALRSVDSAEGVYSSLFAALITTMAGSDCSTSCVNGLRNRPFRCGPGVATRRDKAEPSQVPVLDVQTCVSSLTPQSPTTARQKRRRRCCLRPMGKPRHSGLCIFRCSIAPPAYPAADASRLASRRVAHGSRNRVEWLAPSP